MSHLPSTPVTLAVGDALPQTTVGPLSRTDFVRYAGAAGDFNPIHHDEPFARAAGLPGVFGMGLLHAGILGVHLARWVGPEQLRRFQVRFVGQVWPGDVLTFRGEVEQVADGTAHLALTVTREDGEPVMRASATAAVTAADTPRGCD
jgi:acyl dehydratase